MSVFVDYQNVYMGARDAFGWRRDPDFTRGQIPPRRLGLLLVQRGRDLDAARELSRVDVYRGEPSAKHSMIGQAACDRQMSYWRQQALVHATTRPLKYYEVGTRPDGSVRYEPREKGIDVLLALDLVRGATEDTYDVAVLCSRDTDLVPALERVVELGKRVEVMSWSGSSMSRLRLAGRQVWCHWLDERAYGYVCDPTDYTRPVSDPPD